MRGLIVAGVAGLLVVGVIFVGRGGKIPDGGKPAETGNPAAGPGEALPPVKIVLECEEPATLEDKAPNGMVIIKIESANMGKPISYLNIPDGWIETCGLNKIKDKAGALPGKATYVFDAPRDDTYYVNLRAMWLDDCGNSVWVKIDESEYGYLEDEEGKIGPKNYRWAWHQLEESARPKGFKLAKGKHTLHMAVREDGPKLDQWVISTDANRQTGEAAKKSQ